MSGQKTTLVIRGVKVSFPVKPYPSQMAMMGQIVKGLKRGENCLLESPTGTGKSLALLCATLAWQVAEEDCVQRYNSLIDQGITDPDILERIFSSTTNVNRAQDEPEVPSNQPQPPSRYQNQSSQSTVGPVTTTTASSELGGRENQTQAEGGFIRDDNSMDDEDLSDFKLPSFRFRIAGGNTSEANIIMEETLNDDLNGTVPLDVPPRNDANLPRKKRTPKIYFGTRTHKQIFQIIKELRKTEYKNARSVVLGSREHTCIHPIVSTSRNKNEECKLLIERKDAKDDFCSFYHGANRINTHEQLASFGISTAWDLEDLVKLGKKVKACPYFVSRQLVETAQIIFCPYNYLIDPLIRKNMKIDLKNSVLVLDEAHNVEDSSREAASTSLTHDDILESKNDLEKLVYYGANPDFCKPLALMLSRLSQWMEANKDNLTDYSEFGRTGKIFSGSEIVKELSHLDIDAKSLSSLEGCLNRLSEDPDQEKEAITAKPSAVTSQLLSSFFLMLRFIFKSNMKNVTDYKVALVRTQTFSKNFTKNKSGFFGRSSGSYVYSLNFWCLNPGVAFNELSCTRSIILTSGTLSPMNSFASELQVEFPVRLEANHVISQNQVWVGTIASGPTNHPLNATFKNTETWAFQDELGRMIMEVCEAIPRGILCFLPSYAMLDKLIERWRSSPIWEQIETTKKIISEPRKADDFENAMKDFYQTIKKTSDCTAEGTLNGALFIAVCRGKVSEGLDFTDDNARAVIAVGIPYPNVKDIQVNLKRQYNDMYSNTRGLLSGKEWYEIQAYRALNQALGRCIRHRFDWGAIILVDERYQNNSYGNNKYVKGLSRWVRQSLHHQPSFKVAASKLKNFAGHMTQNPPLGSCEILEPKSTNPGLIEMPKPKFASPPIFRPFSTKEENRIDETPSYPNHSSESKLNSTNLTFKFKERGIEISKPQSATYLTPIKDSQGLPLTPISNESLATSQQPRPCVVFPLTSTQKPPPIFPFDSDIEVVGFVNQQNNGEGNVAYSALSSTPTQAAKLSSKCRNFPPFESAKINSTNTRRSTSNQESPASASRYSNIPENAIDLRFGEVHLLKDDDSFESDDMFGENENNSMTPHPRKKEDKKEKGKKGDDKKVKKKVLTHKLSQAFDKVLIAQNSPTSFTKEEDSDLDDFDMDTSIVGNSSKHQTQSLKRKRKPKKKKGVSFTDYDCT